MLFSSPPAGPLARVFSRLPELRASLRGLASLALLLSLFTPFTLAWNEPEETCGMVCCKRSGVCCCKSRRAPDAQPRWRAASSCAPGCGLWHGMPAAPAALPAGASLSSNPLETVAAARPPLHSFRPSSEPCFALFERPPPSC